MAAVPPQIDPAAVRSLLSGRTGVVDVHDLHIWPMSTTENALTCHLVMPDGHPGDAFLHELASDLAKRFKIIHATVQIEVDPHIACALAPGNLLARLIAFGLAALGGSNALTPLPIEGAETLEIYAHAAVCGHFFEFGQVLAKIVEIMHGRTEYRNLAAQRNPPLTNGAKIAGLGNPGGPYIMAAAIIGCAP